MILLLLTLASCTGGGSGGGSIAAPVPGEVASAGGISGAGGQAAPSGTLGAATDNVDVSPCMDEKACEKRAAAAAAPADAGKAYLWENAAGASSACGEQSYNGWSSVEKNGEYRAEGKIVLNPQYAPAPGSEKPEEFPSLAFIFLPRFSLNYCAYEEFAKNFAWDFSKPLAYQIVKTQSPGHEFALIRSEPLGNALVLALKQGRAEGEADMKDASELNKLLSESYYVGTLSFTLAPPSAPKPSGSGASSGAPIHMPAK